MSVADPQSVTISGVTSSLPRISSGANSGTFKSNDGLVGLNIAHTYGRSRNRRKIELTHSKVSADVFLPSTNVQVGMSAYLVVDVPSAGYTVTEQKAVIDGFIAQLNASSGALITKFLGGEN